MLRILLRLYLLVAALAVLSIVMVERGFPYLFASQFEQAIDREYKTEVFLLRQYLDGQSSQQQQQMLNKLNSLAKRRYHYMETEEIAQLAPAIREKLKHQSLVWKGGGHKCCEIYAPLANGSVLEVNTINDLQWLESVAYVVFLLMLLAAVCIWLVPHWRDLEKLRMAAAKFGTGALDARAGLSGRSSIRQLSSHFDNMADRIGKLIQSQRDMINAVSHELRTPLARLEFGLDNLLDKVTDEAAENRIHALRGDVGELETLVAELLTLGMLEHDRQAVFTERIVLSSFLRKSTGIASEALEQKNMVLTWAIDPMLHEIVTEPRSLARAFSNLMRNAVRHAHGRILIRAEIYNTTHWNLIVEDDGSGIPFAERERVFDSFYRLDQSRQRATGGFGLGLAIVKKIAERHGGNIRVETSELGGAMFVMRLPLQLD